MPHRFQPVPADLNLGRVHRAESELIAGRMVERARRHAVGGCLACLAGFSLVLVLAYWVGPAERLDRSVLDALSTPTDTFVNEAAYVGFLVVNFRPAWVLVGAITVLIALAQWRIRDAVLAAALVAGTGGLVLALKALPRRTHAVGRRLARYRTVSLDTKASRAPVLSADASQPTSRADHRRPRAEPRRDWARR
jgi:hypothetical protein